jgi:hypothetical protein
MFMSANTHEPSAHKTSAVTRRAEENSDLSDVHECKHHEPSADMTSAGSEAQSGDSDLSDVHECKHSMNHLLTRLAL